ncbi:MAG: hypothetical protein A2297_07575 [Elusimicrobia bacterium RIFOXYB2_FULL_48_7]|nr:MAG: hypothetical protein A2297_07575 [Elusimicrobia bacterium RIFOXYB2_FULL_48_7]
MSDCAGVKFLTNTFVAEVVALSAILRLLPPNLDWFEEDSRVTFADAPLALIESHAPVEFVHSKSSLQITVG